jgi:predicted Zn finger-like uncharacterized protein
VVIECPECHSKYQYDEDRFERKASKKIKCARCQTVFEIRNPAFAEAPKPASAADRTSPSKHDSTRASRPTPKLEPEAEPVAPADTGRQQALQLPTGRRLSLAILDGPDAGSVYRIDKPRITIGRAGADLTLNDSEASRLHAALEIHDTSFFLSDLGSTNGTLVGGERLSGPTEISDKAEFQVGVTTLMLIVTDEH